MCRQKARTCAQGTMLQIGTVGIPQNRFPIPKNKRNRPAVPRKSTPKAPRTIDGEGVLRGCAENSAGDEHTYNRQTGKPAFQDRLCSTEASSKGDVVELVELLFLAIVVMPKEEQKAKGQFKKLWGECLVKQFGRNGGVNACECAEALSETWESRMTLCRVQATRSPDAIDGR